MAPSSIDRRAQYDQSTFDGEELRTFARHVANELSAKIPAGGQPSDQINEPRYWTLGEVISEEWLIIERLYEGLHHLKTWRQRGNRIVLRDDGELFHLQFFTVKTSGSIDRDGKTDEYISDLHPADDSEVRYLDSSTTYRGAQRRRPVHQETHREEQQIWHVLAFDKKGLGASVALNRLRKAEPTPVPYSIDSPDRAHLIGDTALPEAISTTEITVGFVIPLAGFIIGLMALIRIARSARLPNGEPSVAGRGIAIALVSYSTGIFIILGCCCAGFPFAMR
jgi:hypothetical protein